MIVNLNPEVQNYEAALHPDDEDQIYFEVSKKEVEDLWRAYREEKGADQ